MSRSGTFLRHPAQVVYGTRSRSIPSAESKEEAKPSGKGPPGNHRGKPPPHESRGKVSEIAKAWGAWGEKNGLLR